MKTILYPLLLISFHLLKAQDSISHRVIFIGDAGEINSAQQKVISEATHYIIKDKTTAIFLGDNIYPRGMGLPNSPEEAETKKILQSQYVPFRSQDIPVYFIPGNHDWDRSGKLGLQKIKAQSVFLQQQQDAFLKLIPTNGCPDPSVFLFLRALLSSLLIANGGCILLKKIAPIRFVLAILKRKSSKN